jgi:hypothetical protein
MPRHFLVGPRALLLGILLGGTLAVDADAAGGAWLVSNAGTGPWEKINASCIKQSRLRGGDFDGDGKTDVFSTWEGKWRASFGGKTEWKIINTSDVGVEDLRFGDFDGDGKTDAFTTWSGKWRVSFGGNTEWKVINTSDVEVADLRFGDRDGNGKTDVFTEWGGQWRVSRDGTKPWEIIAVSKAPGLADPGKSRLVSGNYVGDSRADKFRSDTGNCVSQGEACSVSVIVRNGTCLNVDGTPSTILSPGQTSAVGCGGTVDQARARAKASFRSFACLTEGNQPVAGCCTFTEEVVQGCLCK